MTTVITTGITMLGECSIKGQRCVALEPAPITVVFEHPRRVQVNVCRNCLEDQIRAGNWRVESARVQPRADVAIYRKNGLLGCVVEVRQNPLKSKDPGSDWARKLHRNLIAHSALPPSRYFLILAFPRYIYLWNSDDNDPTRQPDFAEDIDGMLKKFSTDSKMSSNLEMEKVVARWLAEMITGDDSLVPRCFKESGLWEELIGGTVQMQASASRLT